MDATDEILHLYRSLEKQRSVLVDWSKDHDPTGKVTVDPGNAPAKTILIKNIAPVIVVSVIKGDQPPFGALHRFWAVHFAPIDKPEIEIVMHFRKELEGYVARLGLASIFGMKHLDIVYEIVDAYKSLRSAREDLSSWRRQELGSHSVSIYLGKGRRVDIPILEMDPAARDAIIDDRPHKARPMIRFWMSHLAPEVRNEAVKFLMNLHARKSHIETDQALRALDDLKKDNTRQLDLIQGTIQELIDRIDVGRAGKRLLAEKTNPIQAKPPQPGKAKETKDNIREKEEVSDNPGPIRNRIEKGLSLKTFRNDLEPLGVEKEAMVNDLVRIAQAIVTQGREIIENGKALTIPLVRKNRITLTKKMLTYSPSIEEAVSRRAFGDFPIGYLFRCYRENIKV